MDTTDVYPRYLCRPICLIFIDEYYKLAIGAIYITQICALILGAY
jgi:hypothetical protein